MVNDKESGPVPKITNTLSPAAQRALAEAEARRAAAQTGPAAAPEEKGGPAGLEPTRYGDWERRGVATDF